MTRIDDKGFLRYISENVLVTDGASGTQMQRRGLPAGVCPEDWVLAHPQALLDMQDEYIRAGSRAVYTYTFGSNGIKLAEYGHSDVFEINRALAELSVRAADGRAFVGGDVGPTGRLFEPMGDLSFEDAVSAFSEQVRGLAAGGVDFIVIETMLDLAEARAAVIAAKSVCDLPVVVSMTFGEHGRTLTGSTPEAAAVALCAVGADVVGANCSTGPDKLVDVIARMGKVSAKPLTAKPNAGMPHVTEGKTVFDMDAGEFCKYVPALLCAGAAMVGGCCGTDGSFIAGVSRLAQGRSVDRREQAPVCLSCNADALPLGQEPLVVSTSIRPGTEEWEAMAQGEYDDLLDTALSDADSGADVMLIDASGIQNEGEALHMAAETVAARAKLPVCFAAAEAGALEYALLRYVGRALVSVGENAELAAILPVVKRFGAAIALPEELKSRALGFGIEERLILACAKSGEAAPGASVIFADVQNAAVI